MRRKHWPRHGGLGLGLSVGGGGVGYLLNDSFLTDKAAGSVNGTAAEPGPGTRTVIDVDGDLIISSGYLKQANLVNANSTRCYYPATTHVQGRILLAKTNPAGDERYSGLLLDNNTTVDANDSFGMSYGTGTYLLINRGALSTIINTFDHTKDQIFGIILGTPSGGNTPVYYMYKEGTGNWYVVFMVTILDSKVYPIISIYLSSVCATDFIRVPTLLWTPRPISADAFGGAWPTTDGGGLTGLEAGGSGKTWTTAVGATWSNSGGFAVNAPGVGDERCNDTGCDDALKWTAQAGWDVGVTTPSKATFVDQAATKSLTNTGQTATIGTWYRVQALYASVVAISVQIGASQGIPYWSGNGLYTGTCRAIATNAVSLVGLSGSSGVIDDVSVKPLTTAQLIQVIDNGVNDFYAEIDITVAYGFHAGIVFNYTDASNFEIVYLNRNDSKVYWDQCLLGTYTNINTSAAVTPGSGYKLAVRRIGTSLYYWYNNIYVHNNTIVSGLNTTSQGLFSTGNGATEVKFDNWKLYAVGSGGEYSLLDMFCN